MLVGVIGLSQPRLNNVLDSLSVPVIVLRSTIDKNPVESIMRTYLIDREFNNTIGFYITPTAFNEYDRLLEEEQVAFDSLIDYSFLDFAIYVSDGDTARTYSDGINCFEESSLKTILEGLYDECV